MSSTDDNVNDVFLSASSGDENHLSMPTLADTLATQFSDVPGNLNVIHINAQSIPAHFTDMLANLDCTNIHAVFVSESWLKPCLPSVCYSLPGFQLIRNDRTQGRGGGVAIYLRSNISYSVVSASTQPPPTNAGEHLFIEVELHHFKILLGVYYCPSSHIDFFSSVEIILENLIPLYSHTILMGDFNTCLLKNNTRSSRLQYILNSNTLKILPLTATHHFPNTTPSLLDIIAVSSLEHVAKHGQCSAEIFSYHDLLFLSYSVRPPKIKAKILLQRNFRGLNLESLCKDADDIDWGPLFDSNCINFKVSLLISELTKLYDIHAPIRKIKIKHLPAPWLTEEIKILLMKKATAKSRYKRRPNAINWHKYVELRNRCNKVCRNAQRQHIHASVENGDPAKVWKFLRSLGVGKSHNDTFSKNFDIDLLNLHFSASSNFDRTTKDETLRYLSTLPTPDCPEFVFSQFSDCDVKKSIESISSNAIGSDCITRNMILPILDIVLPVITHILNYSISTGVVPSVWKEAQVTPIAKKSNPTSFNEFRPISILPFLSKVLERLIHNQLNPYLTKNSLLNPFQSGFRPGHSTTSALVHITEDIRSGMENGEVTVLALLDFSNAFNTISFDILLATLSSLNISPTAIDWFRSYLFGRRQRIKIENDFSLWCNTSAGVPQGGVLSPLLFAIYINSISKQLLSSYHLYADDLQIYIRTKIEKLSTAICTINNDLKQINIWSANHGLKVNPLKTQVIIVGSSRTISKIVWSNIPEIMFDSVVIPFNTKVKNLGIYIDHQLSWGPQLQEISRKLFAALGSLRRLRNLLPLTTKIALAESLLLPILDYADVSYLDLTEDQLNKLERLQNVCIRFIFGLRKYDHISEFRNKLKWLPIRLRRNTHILSFLYSILFIPNTPLYLKERFQFLRNTHSKSLRSSENLLLKMPNHSTSFMSKSFTVQAVRLWNKLPLFVRRAKSLMQFKTLVKKHYMLQN